MGSARANNFFRSVTLWLKSYDFILTQWCIKWHRILSLLGKNIKFEIGNQGCGEENNVEQRLLGRISRGRKETRAWNLWTKTKIFKVMWKYFKLYTPFIKKIIYSFPSHILERIRIRFFSSTAWFESATLDLSWLTWKMFCFP